MKRQLVRILPYLRNRGLYIAIARSPSAYLAARAAVLLVLMTGMLLISLGFFISAASYARNITALESGQASAGPRSLDPAAWRRPTAAVDGWAGFVPMQILPGAGENAPDLASAFTAGAVHQPPLQEISAAPTAAPEPTSTPPPPGPPERLVIPKIDLDAPVKLMPIEPVKVKGKVYEQWQAPNTYAAGWQQGSAQAGAPGNTVLNGHHNVHGSVFGHLFELDPGDSLLLYSGKQAYPYVVSQVMVLEERNVSIEQRLENARWILPSSDTRLTLVTCWPPDSNTHRLIIVAVPTN